MIADTLHSTVVTAIELMAAILCIGLAIFTLVFVVLYILDVTQTKHAIRKNYPVCRQTR